MNAPTGSINNRKFSFTAVLFIGLLSLIGVQGCSSSNSAAPAIPDQDANGLFKSGTAELNSGATMLDDLRAFVHEGRIIMFSVDGHILYDGQINTIISDDFTATVDVYEVGVKTQTAVAVVGKVTSESQITGTISGTGDASGTFTLEFDSLYTRGASFERVDTDDPMSSGTLSFRGDMMDSRTGATTNNFNFDFTAFFDFLSNIPGIVRCSSSATYTIPDTSINIYVLNETLRKTDVGCTMSESPNYTGFIAAVDGEFTDNTLIFAASNGENAHFAVLIKELP